MISHINCKHAINLLSTLLYRDDILYYYGLVVVAPTRVNSHHDDVWEMFPIVMLFLSLLSIAVT